MSRSPFSVKKIVTHPFFSWPLVAAAAFIVFFIGINHESVWFDETWSLAMARLSLPAIVRRTALDNHPPLYYFMLKPFIMLFGMSEIALRLPSLLGALAFIGLAAGPVRRALGAKTALVFALLVTAAPTVIQMAHETRMYTWAAFFTAAGLVCGFLAVRDNKIKDWILYGLFALAGAYTHYFALVALGLGSLVLFVFILLQARDRLARFAIAAGGAVLLYLPWLFVFLAQTNRIAGGFWVQPLDALLLLKVLDTPFGFRFESFPLTPTSLIALIVAIVAIATGAITLRKERRTEPLLLVVLLCLASFLTLLATALFSLLVRPILIPRYMVACSGVFLLAVAAGLAALKKPLVFLASLAALLLCLLPADIAVHTEAFNGSAREYAAEMKKSMKSADVLLHGDMHTITPLAYYLPDHRHVLVLRDDRAWRADPAFFGPAVENSVGLDELKKSLGGFWLVNRRGGAYPLDELPFRRVGFEETGAIPNLNNPRGWLHLSAVRLEYTGNLASADKIGDLTVKVGPLSSRSGDLLLVLFRRGPIAPPNSYRWDYIPVTADRMEHVFRDIEYGTYAVYALLDRNRNYRLDPDVAGEGVGASVDTELQWGYTFEKMKFDFSKKRPTVDVKINYQ